MPPPTCRPTSPARATATSRPPARQPLPAGPPGASNSKPPIHLEHLQHLQKKKNLPGLPSQKNGPLGKLQPLWPSHPIHRAPSTACRRPLPKLTSNLPAPQRRRSFSKLLAQPLSLATTNFLQAEQTSSCKKNSSRFPPHGCSATRSCRRWPPPAAPANSTVLWGGRFEESVTDAVERFSESVSFDKQLYKHDIMGSRAHATMLAHQDLITTSDRDKILFGLEEIENRKNVMGEFVWRTDREDVHMNIEEALTDMIGEPAKKLHTARSRNDQVVTDLRLWCREAIDKTLQRIGNLQVAMVKLVKKK